MAASADSERTPDMLKRALEYLRLGYPVFPVCSPIMGQHSHGNTRCSSPGKRPLVPWEAYQRRLPTDDEVRNWWTRQPLANIGMATGALSGVVVLDCDSGEARAIAMERGGVDRTPAVWTGKPGGVHYWLEHPIDEVRNFARRLPGLDFRGDGGYVLLPPSAHVSGARYRWAENTAGMRLAPIPEWLWDVLRGGGTEAGAEGEARESLDVEEMLKGFDEGHRDDGLFRFACRLRHDDTPQAFAEILIATAARNCRPSFDESEAVGKVRYVYGKYQAGSVGPTLEMDEEIIPPEAGAASAEADPIGDAAPGVPEPSWQVYDAADFLAMKYPTVAWRVQGFLRDQAILFNFGAPGSIKTYIATDAAIAVATGDLFLGQYECAQGRVLIVQEDTLDSDYQQAYLGPLVRARGIDPERLRGQLFVAPPGGMTLGVPERVKELCAWIEAYKPDLLILDAFYLMHDGEGYGKDLSPIMKRLKALRGKYECAIWVIDHDRKGKGDASSSENPIDRLWGGRQKSAAVDAIVESRPIKGEHGETFLDVIKLRGAKPAEPIRVKLYPDYRLLIEGEGEAEEESPIGTKNEVYEWLCREGGSRTKAQISAGVDLSIRSVEKALYELSRDGLAKKVGKVRRAETWIALRKSEAEPSSYGPTIEFDEDE